MLFVLNYRNANKAISGLWGPFSTRGEADFFARTISEGGVWNIIQLMNPLEDISGNELRS